MTQQPGKAEAIRQARETCLAVIREEVRASWQPPDGAAWGDASVVALCVWVSKQPGTPSARSDCPGFLAALRRQMVRFVKARAEKRGSQGSYDPAEALAWLKMPPAPPPPEGPRPSRDTTPKPWPKEPLAERAQAAREAQAALDRALEGVIAPGEERFQTPVRFNGQGVFRPFEAPPASEIIEETTR